METERTDLPLKYPFNLFTEVQTDIKDRRDYLSRFQSFSIGEIRKFYTTLLTLSLAFSAAIVSSFSIDKFDPNNLSFFSLLIFTINEILISVYLYKAIWSENDLIHTELKHYNIYRKSVYNILEACGQQSNPGKYYDDGMAAAKATLKLSELERPKVGAPSSLKIITFVVFLIGIATTVLSLLPLFFPTSDLYKVIDFLF